MKKLLTLLTILFIFTAHSYSQWTQVGIMPNPGTNPSISVSGPNSVACAGGPSGVPALYKSTNGGVNFVQVPVSGISLEFYCVWMVDSVTFYVGDGGASGGLGGNAKVYKTTNGGTTWTTILETGGSAGFINGIVFSRTNPLVGIIESDPPTSGGVYYIAKTINGGLNWTIQNPPSTGSASAQNSVVVIDSNFYAFGLNSSPARCYLTTNGGANWTVQTLTGLTGTSGFVAGLAFNTNKLYGLAGDNSLSTTVSRTTNSGVPWFSQTIPSTVTTGYTSIKFVPNSNICYLISSSATATVCLKSTDNGANWSTMTFPVTSGVTHMDLIRVGNTVYAYAVNSVGAVYKLIDNIVGITGETSELPNSFSLEQNYPNPFNPETNIGFNIAKATRVKLAVYDMLGREVKMLKDELMQAGRYNIRFDATDLRSGVYYYKLVTSKINNKKKMVLVK